LHARAYRLIDNRNSAVAIDVVGFLRRRMSAGASGEDYRVAAGERLAAVVFQIGDHDLGRAERAHVVALRFVANHRPRRVRAFGHVAHQALTDIAV
jgi:hypothetical protein